MFRVSTISLVVIFMTACGTQGNDPLDNGVCGDEFLTESEICDGDCPSDCNDNNACTMDTLIGSPQSWYLGNSTYQNPSA